MSHHSSTSMLFLFRILRTFWLLEVSLFNKPLENVINVRISWLNWELQQMLSLQSILLLQRIYSLFSGRTQWEPSSWGASSFVFLLSLFRFVTKKGRLATHILTHSLWLIKIHMSFTKLCGTHIILVGPMRIWTNQKVYVEMCVLKYVLLTFLFWIQT